jgi:hypothetical protein
MFKFWLWSRDAVNHGSVTARPTERNFKMTIFRVAARLSILRICSGQAPRIRYHPGCEISCFPLSLPALHTSHAFRRPAG